MTLTLNEDVSSGHRLMFEGDLSALTKEITYKAYGSEDRWVVFDGTKVAEALKPHGLVSGDEHVSYGEMGVNQPWFWGLQYRRWDQEDEPVEVGTRLMAKHFPHETADMRRLKSPEKGALVVNVNAMHQSRDQWYLTKPTEEHDAPTYLAVSVFHALAGKLDGSKIASYVLMDLNGVISGKNETPTILGSTSSENRVVLTPKVLEYREWAVLAFEETLQRLTQGAEFAELHDMQRHLHSGFGWSGGIGPYDTSTGLSRDRPEETLPLAWEDVMAALTHDHYKPLLEKAAKKVRSDANLQRLLDAL